MSEEQPKLADATLKHCRRCGHDCSTNPQPVATEEEIQEYIRTVLADRPYAKSYGMFGGQVKIGMSALTSKESTHMAKILREAGTSDTMDSMRIQLLYYLRTYRDTTYKAPIDIEDLEGVREEFNNRFGQTSEDLVAVMVRTFTEFIRLLQLLTESAFDANFWKGAGLG